MQFELICFKKDKKLGKVIDKNLITELQGLVKQPKNDMVMNVIVAYRDPGDGSRKEQLKQFKEQMNLQSCVGLTKRRRKWQV